MIRGEPWWYAAGVLDSGKPYVIAADVCKVAGVKNVPDALSRLDDDQKGVISIHAPAIGSTDSRGQTRNLSYVTESGFYDLILGFRLRKESPNYQQLRRVKRWVCDDVLPSIREKGHYAVPGATVDPPPPPQFTIVEALRTAPFLWPGVYYPRSVQRPIPSQLRPKTGIFQGRQVASSITVRGSVPRVR